MKKIQNNESVNSVANNIDEILVEMSKDYRNGWINPLQFVESAGNYLRLVRASKAFDKGVNLALIGFADFLSDVYLLDEDDVRDEIEVEDIADYSLCEDVREKYEGRLSLRKEVESVKSKLKNAEEKLACEIVRNNDLSDALRVRNGVIDAQKDDLARANERIVSLTNDLAQAKRELEELKERIASAL